jgi:hypothetical protein
LHLVKSVGYCYRNRLTATLCDVLKWYKWEEGIKSLKAAEEHWRQHQNDYIWLDMSSAMKEMRDVSLRQEKQQANLNRSILDMLSQRGVKLSSSSTGPWIVLPYAENPTYVHRKKVFQQLQDLLAVRAESASQHKRAALWGLGGTGCVIL